MTVHWTIRPFQSLDVGMLHDVLKLRTDVFVVEQRCIYPEVDGRDPEALHVLGSDEHGELVAYARVLPPGDDGVPHIGRVVVHPAHRGHGLGREVMVAAIDAVQTLHGTRRCAVAAQTYLEQFYQELGFIRQGDDYDWDGIPHVDMLREG